MFVSTLIPPSLDPSNTLGSIVHQSIDSLIDLIAITSLLKSSSGNSIQSVIAAALSWSFTSIVLANFIPLWIGTRQLEFSPEFLLLSINANFKLFSILSLFVHLWIAVKTFPKVHFLVLLPLIVSLGHNHMHTILEFKTNDMMMEYGAKFLFSLVLCLAALFNYLLFSSSKQDSVSASKFK
ncbi:hypothetical protein Ciccas_007001 [Cichlidogyrus casuarinus]|uniref:BOS complex subunit TMEM147 n=1 Tax=Cichlidogyrus casuarinus TaxID=1844966 RepID=A0ABD2Q452_9PLAT